MARKITTRKQNNAQGAPQILAKGSGKQRTISYDLSQSAEWNHGTAAGVLAQALDYEWSESIAHESNDDGSVHTFQF